MNVSDKMDQAREFAKYLQPTDDGWPNLSEVEAEIISRMLNEYADLLEAQEKAEPVGEWFYENKTTQCSRMYSAYLFGSDQARAKLGQAVVPDEISLYTQLILAVESKFPNETRHETALRYIRQCEKGKNENAAMLKGEK